MKKSKSTGKINTKRKVQIEYESESESEKMDKQSVKEKEKSKSAIESKGTNSKLAMMKAYESTIKFPKDFQKVWDKIQKMRDSSEAPVDTMGVECCPDSKADRPTYKFQTLVSLILSSQTKDPITFAAMDKLIKHGLTVDKIIDTNEETLKELIYGVSFYNNKTKYVKQLAQVLKDKYEYEAPEDVESVLTLPGVGPKMAFLYLQCCCDKNEGIAVDTHVHRICNRLKWVNETKTPEYTRRELETWLPKHLWGEINTLLVGFGQTICAAVAPKCEQCTLNKICEFGINRLKEKEKKSKSKSKSREKLPSKAVKSKTESNIKTESKNLKRKSEIINTNSNANEIKNKTKKKSKK